MTSTAAAMGIMLTIVHPSQHPVGRAVAIALALAATVCSAPLLAGESDAKTYFAEGRRLRLEGDCAAALVDFNRAYATYPDGLGSLRNIAECEEELGRYASARRHYWDLRTHVMRSGALRYAGWVDAAEASYKRLADKVAKLVVEVKGPAGHADIIVNGETIEWELLSVPLERDPGPQKISVRVNGVEVDGADVSVESGQRRVVQLVIPEDAEETTQSERGVSAMFAGGVAAVGIGGLSFVGMGVAIGMRQAAISELAEVCPDYDSAAGGPCRPNAEDPEARGKLSANLANVFGVIAGVATVAGVTLLVVDATADDADADEGPDATEAGPTVSFGVGPGSFSVFGRF